MAISITSSVKTTSQQWAVTVVLTSYDVIADPAGYVTGSTDVQAEILSRAGLDADVVFIAAALESSTIVGLKRQYSLTVTYGDALTAGGHTHGCSTVTYPLQCGYDTGPSIALDATLGPLVLSRPTTADMTFFQAKYGTTDLFKLSNTGIKIGGHTEFSPDATYDLGTPDDGVSLRRPRDARFSRDLYVGQNGRFGGFGIFAGYTRAQYSSLAPQAVNPSTDASVRHVYNNSVDNSLHYWDGAVDHIIGASSGSDTVGTWNCDAGVAQYDVVFCDGADHVNRASAISLAGRGIVGICISKLSATSALVRYSGEITGFGGLMPGASYYVSTAAGGLTSNISGFLPGYTIVQVGIAKNTTTLVYQPGDPDIY
jgi:hypothetical protein